MNDQPDNWNSFFREKDHFYLAYHKDSSESIWRRISPCLHCWSGKCPLGKQCGFPTENDVASLYQEEKIFDDALGNYKELQRLIENEKELLRLVEKRKRKAWRKMIRNNQKLLSLPLERYLLQYRLALKKEMCRNKVCLDTSSCERAHSIWDLFRQFDQPFLLDYYSHHFNKVFRPILPKKSSHKIELICLEVRCRSKSFHRSVRVILHTSTGELLEPRISLTCLCCGNVTHFLVYLS